MLHMLFVHLECSRWTLLITHWAGLSVCSINSGTHGKWNAHQRMWLAAHITESCCNPPTKRTYIYIFNRGDQVAYGSSESHTWVLFTLGGCCQFRHICFAKGTCWQAIHQTPTPLTKPWWHSKSQSLFLPESMCQPKMLYLCGVCVHRCWPWWLLSKLMGTGKVCFGANPITPSCRRSP